MYGVICPEQSMKAVEFVVGMTAHCACKFEFKLVEWRVNVGRVEISHGESSFDLSRVSYKTSRGKTALTGVVLLRETKINSLHASTNP